MVISAPGVKIPKSDLYSAYEQYCVENGDTALSVKEFSKVIKDRGYNDTRDGGTRYWTGLRFSVGDEKARKALKSLSGSNTAASLPV